MVVKIYGAPFRQIPTYQRDEKGRGGGDSLPGVKALIRDIRTVYVSFVLEIETLRAGARKGEGCLSVSVSFYRGVGAPLE